MTLALVIDHENRVFLCELYGLVWLRQQRRHILHSIEVHLRSFLLELRLVFSEKLGLFWIRLRLETCGHCFGRNILVIHRDDVATGIAIANL